MNEIVEDDIEEIRDLLNEEDILEKDTGIIEIDQDQNNDEKIVENDIIIIEINLETDNDITIIKNHHQIINMDIQCKKLKKIKEVKKLFEVRIKISMTQQSILKNFSERQSHQSQKI